MPHPPSPPSTAEYLALGGGSRCSSSPCQRRSTVKAPQYRAPPSACLIRKQPAPPSPPRGGGGRSSAPPAGSFGAAASPLPEPRSLSFGRNRGRPVSPSNLPLLDGEQCDLVGGSQLKKKKKGKKIRLALRVPGKGGASRLVSMGRGATSALLSAVTRSRGRAPAPSSAPPPPEDTEEDGPGPADLSGETFVHDGPNFFAPAARRVAPPRVSRPSSPDDRAAEPAPAEPASGGAHSTVLAWSCLLALAGSLSLLAGNGARIVVTYCSDDEEEDDNDEADEECTSAWEGDLCGVPDLDGAHSLDEFIDDDCLGELDVGPATSTSDMLALGALGMLLGAKAPRAVRGAGRRPNESGGQAVWGAGDDSSLPSIEGSNDEEASLPSLYEASDETSLPSIDEEDGVYEASDETSLPSIDEEDSALDLGDLPSLDACPAEEDAAPRTDASDVAGLSLLGMLLGSPAPRCVPPAGGGGNARTVVWESDDGASLPSLDGACMDDAGIPSVDGEGDESSLPSVDGGDDASIPSMGGEGDASVDFPFDECSLPSVDGGDDASIPSMDGESDGPDLEGLPPLDASPSSAGQEAYASEVAGWGLLGMFLGSPAPSCVPPSKSGRTRKSANLWDDRAVADDLDGVLPDRREGAALSSGGARHRSDPSLMPSLSGISDDDSAEDDSLPPSMDDARLHKDGPAAEPLGSSPNDVMAWGTLVAILSSPAPSPVRGRKAAGGRAGPSLWEECDVPLPPEL